MPKTFLLIGKSGLLGSSFAKALASTNLVTPTSAELNITDANTVSSFIAKVKPNVIINCSGYNQVDAAEEPAELEKCKLINVTGVANLVEAANAHDAALIQFSSDYVFDGAKEAGYAEEDADFGPASNYAKCKRMAEEAVQNANKFYLVRLSWLFGPGGGNFVTTMLRLADQHENLTVVNDQHGKPTYTEDAVQATLQLLEDEAPFGTYHLVNEGPTTWFEFAKKIFALAGKSVNVAPVSSKEFKRPAQRPAHSVLLNTKRPQLRHWEEALADYLKTLN